MSKAKHTPAPWSVSERTYENSKGAKYLTVDHLVNGSGVEGLAVVYEGCLGEDSIAKMEANARLIAQAPTLLSALEISTSIMESVVYLFGDSMAMSTKFGLTSQIKSNRELIKKTEG